MFSNANATGLNYKITCVGVGKLLSQGDRCISGQINMCSCDLLPTLGHNDLLEKVLKACPHTPLE